MNQYESGVEENSTPLSFCFDIIQIDICLAS